MVINVLGKPILSGPLESDIVTVRDMSEITTENKVYCVRYCGQYCSRYLAFLNDISIFHFIQTKSTDRHTGGTP